MIDITENTQEELHELLTAENQTKSKEFDDLSNTFEELLEASLYISYELDKIGEEYDSIHLRIIAGGFDNIIKKCHTNYLQIKK